MRNQETYDDISQSRRKVLVGTVSAVAAATVLTIPGLSATPVASASPSAAASHSTTGGTHMGSSKITMKDGVEIYYKDWGSGQPIVFSHGWPLSADDWDAQMLFFLSHGYRVIAHDRRGHGRSTQTADGNDMDHYAADLAALTEALDLHNAIHVGHSHWRWRSGAVRSASWHGPHGKDRAHQLRTADHGQDQGQPGRHAD